MNKKELATELRNWWRQAYDSAYSDEDSVWIDLYFMVFSDNVANRILKEFPDFNYTKLNISYKADAEAFIGAFCQYAEKE